MKIKILPAYTQLPAYFSALTDGVPMEQAWQETMLAPYWDTLCQYAPMDLQTRKPRPIPDTPALRAQAAMLDALSLSNLQEEFTNIVQALPKDDTDPVYVALYPGNAEDELLRIRHNGVNGVSLFGNVLLRINPLAPNYMPWLTYVFAHEYHHSAWGYYHYILHPEQTDADFLTALLIDGEADSFARTLYPQLRPQWLFSLAQDEIRALWHTKYAELAQRTDVDYETYMFGSTDAGIPWCAGYAVGYALVQDFLYKNPQVDMPALLKLPPQQILEQSGWKIL